MCPLEVHAGVADRPIELAPAGGGVGSLLETGHLVDFAIRNEQHGGDLHENGCFPIRKRVAPCRNHGPGSIPYWKMDH